MSLENLLERIQKDAKKRVNETKGEAQKEAEAIVLEATQNALENKKKRLDEARNQAQIEKEAALAKARLDARDIILQNKRNVISKSFEQAFDITNRMSSENYEKWILRLLINNSKGTEKVIMADSSAVEIIRKANQSLSESGENAQLKVSEEKIKDRGFILVDEIGSRTDFTIRSMTNFHEQELEHEVFSILMKENPR